jgi:hypothetical protein
VRVWSILKKGWRSILDGFLEDYLGLLEMWNCLERIILVIFLGFKEIFLLYFSFIIVNEILC